MKNKTKDSKIKWRAMNAVACEDRADVDIRVEVFLELLRSE